MALTTRVTQAYAISLMTVCMAGPALAAEPEVSPRYEMERIEGGFLRLDRQTGEVSHCKEIQGAWACQLVPDERKAYEKCIGDLEEKNTNLRNKLENKPGQNGSAELPSKEEMDKAFSFFDTFMGRFAEMARKFREHMQNMDTPPENDPHKDNI